MSWFSRLFDRHNESREIVPETAGVLTAAAQTGMARRHAVFCIDHYESQRDPIGALVHDINQARQQRIAEEEGK